MDMAGARALQRTAYEVRRDPVKAGGLRLIPAAEARDPAFLAAWEELVEEACEPNPFFEPWFLLPAIANLRADERVVIKACYTGGKLKGLFPAVRGAPYYGYPIAHATGWLHENAFCGVPLIAHGHEREFWRACLTHFDRQPRWAVFLHLPQMPADGPANRALEAELALTGRLNVIVDEAERAFLSSGLSSEEYYAQAMSAKKRKELRRQHKRLSEKGELSFARRSDTEGLDEWIAEFLALESGGWKGEAGSALASASSTRAFFTETLHAAAEARKLERLCLRLDGKPIAMLANLVTPPGIYSFKTAFDERYARFSPGLLLQLENLTLLDRGEVHWADSCAVEGHSMIERLWRQKRRIVSRNIAIGGTIRRTAFKALMAYETRNRKVR